MRQQATPVEHGQVPPQAPDIEQAILGSMLLSCTRAMSEVGDLLTAEVFFVHEHGLIYTTIADMYSRGDAVDSLTVVHELKRRGILDTVGGAFYIAQLTSKVSSHIHIHHHALIVLQEFIARETIRLNTEAISRTYQHDDPFELISETIANMEQSIAKSIRRRATRYSDAEAEQLDRLNDPKVETHTSGFRSLDRVIGGFQPGNLVVIAGRPGMGKSALAFSSVSEAAEKGYPTGLFSMELTETQGQARLYSRRSGVALSQIVGRAMTAEQIQKRHEGLSQSADLPLWIRYDTALTLADIKAEATRMKRQHGVRCIVIDQLNWIAPPKAQNRDAAVGEITRGLKMMALQLDICVVLLHQLNRNVESRGGDKRPQLSDMRDSGNVEQDAQVVLFPYRPEYYGIMEDDHGSTIGLMEVIVAKNSNGPLESVRLWFDPPTAAVREAIERAEFNPAGPFTHTPDNDDAPF